MRGGVEMLVNEKDGALSGTRGLIVDLIGG